MSDSSGEQYSMKSCTPITSLARLVNDGFSRQLSQFIDNIVTPFSSHQQPSHRPLITDAHCMMAIWGTDLSELL